MTPFLSEPFYLTQLPIKMSEEPTILNTDRGLVNSFPGIFRPSRPDTERSARTPKGTRRRPSGDAGSDRAGTGFNTTKPISFLDDDPAGAYNILERRPT